MFKKFTALLLITAFTQAYAFTPIQQSSQMASELNKTFDEFNFKLNVEWDQKDTAVFDQTVKDLEGQIADLQKQGLTNNDLIQNSLNNIKDKKIQDEMSELAKVIDQQNMTQEEARSFILAKLSSTYAHGASWSGSRTGGHCAYIICLIIVVLVVCHCRDRGTISRTPVEEQPPVICTRETCDLAA